MSLSDIPTALMRRHRKFEALIARIAEALQALTPEQHQAIQEQEDRRLHRQMQSEVRRLCRVFEPPDMLLIARIGRAIRTGEAARRRAKMFFRKESPDGA